MPQLRRRAAVLVALVAVTATQLVATRAAAESNYCTMTARQASTTGVDPTRVCLPPPPAGRHWMGWAEALRWAYGNTVGLKTGTHGEQSQITGWIRRNPGTARRQAKATVQICEGVCGGGLYAARRDSWWNPFSWDWGGVMGKLWNGIFVACAKGLRAGLLNGAGAGMITAMVTRGAVFELTPTGAALVVVGSCFAGISGS